MDPILPNRHSTRLPSFDYGQDCAVFFSVVIEYRERMLGHIQNGVVGLFPAGEIVKQEWLATPRIRPGITLDQWVIMPDHFQAIVFIDQEIHRGDGGMGGNGPVGAHRCAPEMKWARKPRTIGSFIAQFKATTTRRINELRGTPGQKVWQRNYHDRIIRNEVELDKIRRYIRNNPRFG